MSNDLIYASEAKPWLKYYKNKYLNAEVFKGSMYSLIKENCKEMHREDVVALSYFGLKVKYKELFENIDKYAGALSTLNIKKGDYVTILSVSIPETIYTIYALNKLGAVCNFIDVRTDAPHIKEYILKAKSNILITLEMCVDKISDSLDELGLDYVICQNPLDSLPFYKRAVMGLKMPNYHVPYDNKRIIKNKDFIKSNMNHLCSEVQWEPNMPAIITRTGGTTGSSKGVVLTNENLNAISLNFRASVLDDAAEERSLLNFLPVGVSYGIAVGLHMAISMGCTDILIPKFELDKFADYIIKYKPNHIIAVPVFYEKLISSPKLVGKDLSFIHTMAAGGDATNDALEDKLDKFRLEHNIEFPIAQGYGMSEASSAVSFGLRNLHKKGSAGIPSITVTVAAFKPDSFEELPIGEVGELCIYGATVMQGYLDEPEETKNVLRIHPDGKAWVHSGDLGYIDEDGFVYIVGRMKRTIVRFDGHKSYPLQIERVVMEHELIENCSVIPVRDPTHIQGELPLVVVELKDGCTKTQEEIKKEVLDMCIKGVELRSQPIDVVYVDEIPLTQSSKNNVLELQEKYYKYLYNK